MTLDLSTAAAAVVDDPDPRDPVAATLEALRRRLIADRPTNIGFPSTFDFDYTELYPFFGLLMNNVGDPYTPSAFPANCKDLERDVVEWAADLLHAPAEDRWGYVTTGGSEGNLYALHLARNVVPRAVVYYADSAHYSIDKAIQLLDMTSVRIRADQWGQIDYDDLTVQIDRRRDRPAVVVATVGTTMTEAVNDVRRVNAILDNLAVRERFVHADAALSGLTARSAIPVRLAVDLPRRPGATIEAVAYFVVSEALTNVARHAGANRIDVTVDQPAADRIRVRVADDGRGGADIDAGTGIRGLAQRVGSVDGTLEP